MVIGDAVRVKSSLEPRKDEQQYQQVSISYRTIHKSA